jgi:hypothetical protein
MAGMQIKRRDSRNLALYVCFADEQQSRGCSNVTDGKGITSVEPLSTESFPSA